MEQNPTRGGWLVTLGQFAAWFITALGTIIDILYLREAIVALLTVLQVTHQQNFQRNGGLGIDFTFSYGLTAIDEAIFVVLAIIAMGMAVAIEYYFRKGRLKGLLLKRIGIVVGIEIAIIIVSIIFQQIV
ncbi:MAG TPA: hypothetical protein VF326_00015 [Anaerolineaceae bacterium]|jgi:hypothetical protein